MSFYEHVESKSGKFLYRSSQVLLGFLAPRGFLNLTAGITVDQSVADAVELGIDTPAGQHAIAYGGQMHNLAEATKFRELVPDLKDLSSNLGLGMLALHFGARSISFSQETRTTHQNPIVKTVAKIDDWRIRNGQKDAGMLSMYLAPEVIPTMPLALKDLGSEQLHPVISSWLLLLGSLAIIESLWDISKYTAKALEIRGKYLESNAHHQSNINSLRSKHNNDGHLSQSTKPAKIADQQLIVVHKDEANKNRAVFANKLAQKLRESGTDINAPALDPLVVTPKPHRSLKARLVALDEVGNVLEHENDFEIRRTQEKQRQKSSNSS